MNDRPTIRSTYRDRPASGPLIGLPIALFAGLIAGLVALGWWYYSFRVNREAEIRQDSFNRQTLSQDQVVKLNGDLAEIDLQLVEPSLTGEQKTVLGAQREAIAEELCMVGARVNDPRPEVAEILGEEC